MTDRNIQAGAGESWTNKSELEKSLSMAIYGTPEIKREEKVLYLGEFKERVIRFLTKKQIAEPFIYPEVTEALEDKRAVRLVVNGDIADGYIEKYKKIARRIGKPYSVVFNPDFKGEVGLAVVASDAVDVDEIQVVDREVRLIDAGLSKNIINAVGKKICSRCLEKINYIDPSEAKNYQRLTLLDRLLGEHCAACAGSNKA